MSGEILIFIATVLTFLYFWQKRTFNYWMTQNVKSIKPIPILGNLKELFSLKQNFGEQMWTLHKDSRISKEPAIGMHMLTMPALLIRDVELIKAIFIKYCNNFPNRHMRADPVHDPVGNQNLFIVRNPEWRNLRSKLTPVFSSGKIKQMYPLMIEVGREIEEKLKILSSNNSALVDVKDISARFTTDVIGSIIFGINANALKDVKSEFYVYNLAILEATLRRAIEFAIVLLMPYLISPLRIKVFSKKGSAFFTKSIKHVIAEREKSGVVRNDLIDTLIAMKKEALAHPENSNPAKNLDFLVAQAVVFQSAGFETSSSTMTFALYELALQPDLQDRLRREIINAIGENLDHISYEKIQEMPYLKQVVDETLRKYPVLPFLERECSPEQGKKDFSLKPFVDFNVPSGMPVYVSILGLHRDEKYWSDPEKFDPERFSLENQGNINWNAYLPFGTGPHNCIGSRLGLLQSKLGLVHFLRTHRVVRCEQIPNTIQFDPKSFTLASKSPILLKVERV